MKSYNIQANNSGEVFKMKKYNMKSKCFDAQNQVNSSETDESKDFSLNFKDDDFVHNVEHSNEFQLSLNMKFNSSKSISNHSIIKEI